MKTKSLILGSIILLLATQFLIANGQDEKSSQPAAEEKITITILDHMAYATDVFQELLDGYTAANPNIEFEIQHASNGYQPVRMARINSGQVPDIMTGQTGSDVSTLYDYAYDFTGDPMIDKFTETALATSVAPGGEIYSLPWVLENMSIIYNKTLFEKAGISKLPETMSELEDVCKTLESAGITPFGVGFAETWVISHTISHFIGAEGSDPQAIVDAITAGELSFADMKKFGNSFKMIDLMIKYGTKKPLEVNWESSENMLSNGDVAMIHMGDWAEPILKEFNPDVQMAFMPMPVSEDPKDAVIMSNVAWQFVLNKNSKHFEEARAALEYILTSEAAMDWMGFGIGSAPPTKKNNGTSGILSGNALEYIESGKSKGWNHVLWPNGFNPFLGGQYQDYILNNVTPEEVNSSLNEEWLFLSE